jgi:ABC-2 type transport system permease protein
MDRILRDLKGAYTIWYRDVLRFSRDRARIIASLGQPLLYLFVFGTGLAPAMQGMGGGALDFRQFMFPGIIAMAVLFTAIFSAVSVVWDREFGFLKEVMVAPVSRTAVALGKVAGGATVAMFQGIIVLGVRLGIAQIAGIVGLMLLLATVMTAFGLLIAARQRTMEGFQMIMQFLMMPMFFLSGAFFPLRGVPLWMLWLARVDPVTYGVDSIRVAALSGSLPRPFLEALTLHPMGTNVVVMTLLAGAFIVPAVWQFGRQD